MNLPLVVWSTTSMAYFGQVVARTLDAPLVVDGPVPDCHTVYIIGLYDPPTYNRTIESTKRADRRIIHFCGTDVLKLTRLDVLPEATYLCESENLQEELAELGIEAKVATFPTAQRFPVAPLPDKPVISVYMGSNPAFYGARTVEQLQEVFPDVEWHTYPFGHYTSEQMPGVVAQSSMLVRLTPHDGSANSAREFMEGGRRVVGTTDLPFVDRVRLTDFDRIVRSIRKALKATEPDWGAAAYYHEFNSRERYLADLEGVL